MGNKLKECIEKGECDVVLYKLDGCPHCHTMKNKLDSLDIPYTEKDANDELVDMTGIQTAPQVIITTKHETRVVLKPTDLDDLL